MLDHTTGAGSEGVLRVDFDPRVRLEFHGSKISSDGGLLLFRELDETLRLHELAGRSLRDTRTGKNRVHNFIGLLRQSTFGRLAGYPDVNDADRLARDPMIRQIVCQYRSKSPQLCRSNFPQFSVFGDEPFYASVLLFFLGRPRFLGGGGGVIGAFSRMCSGIRSACPLRR